MVSAPLTLPRPEARPLRVGVLGAARIVRQALIDPLVSLPDLRVSRIAARDLSRARDLAFDVGIPAASATYADLVAADDVDMVYNPLPASLHAQWSIAALRAGKHVLCEKPFAANATEAAEMVAVARAEARCLGEAFHHRYHPLFERVLAVVASGALGPLQRLEGTFTAAIGRPDIRWDVATGGGSLMDLGCYVVSWFRHVTGEEPSAVRAEAETDGADPLVDAVMTAELTFPSGVVAHLHTSMRPEGEPERRFRVEGVDGWLEVTKPISPQRGNHVVIETAGGRTVGPVDAGNSYVHMWRAFADHVAHGTPFVTSGADAVANMAAIDAIYRAAGLPPRST